MNMLADSMLSGKTNLTTMAMPEQALTLRADIDAFYKAGYRDGSINYELEHCPACKNVADLQVALDENAKLRKFMSDILTYGYDGGFLCSNGVWSCPHFQECFNCPIEEGPEQYVSRGCRWFALARELGIEVPE